jgi:hypothetical protein
MPLGPAALAIVWLWGAAAAEACSCQPSTPAEGFDHAQYVFTGEIVEAGTHTWVVAVDRVWKGRATLTSSARLMDVYARMPCEFYFKKGERYLFFAVVAKSPRDGFYHPQACNWTSPLHSRRVLAPDGNAVWLEDLIVQQHGAGEPPGDARGSGRLP